MNLYRAKDYSGAIIGVVFAKSREIADAFFTGRGQTPHSMDEITQEWLAESGLSLAVVIKMHEIVVSGNRTHYVEDRRG